MKPMKSLSYDTIVFDLDGTLTDSREGIENSIRYALTRMNRPCPDEKTLSLFLGPPLAESFIRYCGMNEDDARAATGFYRERYVPQGMFENAVFPGIRFLLKKLRRDGVRLCVATGKPMNATEPILRHFCLYDLFDAVVCPDPGDLHADKGALITQALSGDPKGKSVRALMVGDIAGDILGGHAAGTDTCAAMWGYGGAAVMEALPTFTCGTPDELYEKLYGEKPEQKGFFISLEGLDGCGKTTQQRLLSEALRRYGYETVLTREPGGCPIAEDIRKILLTKEDTHMRDETEALLFAAARAQHLRDTIGPALAAGKVVLCDRYLDSSIVYQGFGRGLGEDWIRQINRAAARLPDVTVYVRLSAQEAIRRRFREDRPDRIEQSGNAFFTRAEKAFDLLAEREKERFLTVDGSLEIGQIAEIILNKVLPKIQAATDP